jgi:hypothetical protein
MFIVVLSRERRCLEKLQRTATELNLSRPTGFGVDGRAHARERPALTLQLTLTSEIFRLYRSASQSGCSGRPTFTCKGSVAACLRLGARTDDKRP